MNSKQKPVKYTAFISHIEWFLYYLVIPRSLRFSNDAYFLNQVTLNDYRQRLQNAISFLEILEFRNAKTIPISFQATLWLLRLPLLERDPYLSAEDRNKLMLLSITRIVNMLCDTADNSKLGRSIARILQQLNLKDHGLISEVRHMATHKLLPSIDVTETAVKSFYEYIVDNYWDKQFDACAPFLRDNQAKVFSFIEKVSQEEPHLFQTNLSGWDDITFVLNSRKGKHKAKGSDKIGLEKSEKTKSSMKRAMRILDYLNKMIFHLKKFELRQPYVQKNFEKDLFNLGRLLKPEDRILFQKYIFLQYRVKQIILFKELTEEFEKIIQAIEASIPNVVKDLQSKSPGLAKNSATKDMVVEQEKPEQQEENKQAENGQEEKIEEKKEKKEEASIIAKLNKMEEQIPDNWMPEPVGKIYMLKMNL